MTPSQIESQSQGGIKRGLQGDAVTAISGHPDSHDLKDGLQSALEHQEAGRYRDAIECLQVWIGTHPHDVDAQAYLALSLFSNKQVEQALKTLNNALNANADSAVVQRIRARLLINLKRADEAFHAAHLAYKADSNDPENQAVLAAALGAKGQNAQAMTLLESALKLRPNYAEALANRALLKMRLGDAVGALQDAESALTIKPHLVAIWPILALLRYKSNNLSGAIQAMEEALKYNPEEVSHLVSLSEMKRQTGETGAAIAIAQKAISLAKGNAAAWANLGAALQQAKRVDEAKDAYLNALAIRPELPEVINNLGVLAKDEENWEVAIVYFEQASGLQPENVDFLINCSGALAALGRHEESESIGNRAIIISPNHPEVLNFLGNASKELGRLIEAESRYRQALAAKPEFAEAYSNLGIVLQQQKRSAEAEDCYRKALTINPLFSDAWLNLGVVCGMQGRVSEAESCYQHALDIKHDFVAAYLNLGSTLKDRGLFLEAEAQYRQALQIKPDYDKARSGLLFVFHYITRPPSHYLAEALQLGDRFAEKVKACFTNYQCSSRPDRLRVGIVSGDLRSHPVGYFIESFLPRLDPARIELFAYSTNPVSDVLTERIKRHFSVWRALFGQNDEAAAKLIHDDGIHVLLDLSGHTGHNRLPVFAWKPAPVQASWLGYFASTGLREMDYLIGDPYVTPPDEEDHFREKIWRLPETYLCFNPPDMSPDVNALPALSDRIITFGCFNKLAKMNDAVVSTWARVLREVPKSRLFLKTDVLNDRLVREEVCRRFAQSGIQACRLMLEGSSPRAELLEAYSRVDIALDPFPYPGGTTSVEALWMGVPVITRRGDRFLSHVGETIVHNAGLSGWIAVDDDDYVAKAVAYASDLERLSALRAGLRQQVLASPLFDALRFARHLENALWQMWQSRHGMHRASC